MKKVTKAIIPAAGLGTRFLPQTKAMPKEMLPIIDKPIIQYVVEEAVAAGITDIIIVTGAHKRSVEDHFDHHYQLEASLEAAGKTTTADQLRQIADMANFIYIRQKGATGTGVPILNAAHLLNDEPFLVLFGDDFFTGKVPRAVQLVQEYEQSGQNIISLTPLTDRDKAGAAIPYAVPKFTKTIHRDLFEIQELIEKPAPAEAASDFASVGGYLLTSEALPLLANQEIGRLGELELADTIDQLAKQGKVYGKVIDGQYYDTGNPEKYLEAVIDVALADPKLGPGLQSYLKNRLK